jgi:hypothetical protein
MTCRALLGSALEAAMVPALESQTPNPPARIHDSFDIDWRLRGFSFST